MLIAEGSVIDVHIGRRTSVGDIDSRGLLSAKHLVLGLLIARPAYGYDIQHRFADQLATFGFHKGRVYKALNALSDDGLIEALGEPAAGTSRRGSPRVYYAATEMGVEAHRAWIRSPARMELSSTDLEMRLAVAQPDDLAPLLDVIEQEIRVCIGQLQGLARPALADVAAPTVPWKDAAMLLVDDRSARQLQADVDWLETLQTVLERRLGEPAT